MVLYAISSFINAAIDLVFVFFIFLKYRKGKVYYFFYLVNFAFLFWSISYGIWQFSGNAESALFWSRMLSIGATLIVLFSFHFTTILLGIEKKQRFVIIFAYLQCAVYLAFGFSPLFISTVAPTFGFDFWPKPGIIFHFYVIFGYVGLMFYSTFLLFDSYRKAVGIQKEQIKYASFAYMLTILGGLTNFPYWYGVNIPPWGNFLTFFYPVIMSYVLSRYRLIDIDVTLGKIFTYTSSFLSFIITTFFLTPFVSLFQNRVSENIFYASILIFGIFLYQIFFSFYQKIASRIFYSRFDSLQKIVANVSKQLISILDLNKLNDLIIETMTMSMGSDHVALLFKGIDKRNFDIKKNVGFDENDIIALVYSDAFVEHIGKSKMPILYEEIFSLKVIQLEKGKKSEIELCLPLIREDEVIGLIILGRKISGDSYSNQDIDLLTTLSNQVSIAIENAKLYDQVQDFSKNLQKKVDDQTRELRGAYELEKKARVELEKLDTTKNQFLLATQHHLRTPLTAMKWSTDLLLKRKLNAKNKALVENFHSSTGKLIKMVNEFLDITQFQLGKNVAYLKSNIVLQDILSEIVDELKFEKNEKKIFLKLENFKENNLILADRTKIKAAIFNIIDNAIKYTNEGGVTVSVEKKDKFMLLKVKDTGIGISKENLTNMFDKVFERGQVAQKTFATGRGIGLYIASQIIKAHNGKIWAESEGEGKGSCFYIELPI